ncbi:hypothetical protein GGE12_000039 [Rhizobium mongolense]|uniref:Uncharacterized protein n=1 Tax=Rhizobium mongolense TaxID=57676 RepID=A0A7W6RHC3_9HYPH|nr:hypothetical protein [Rhizobium mongolense]
MDFTVIDATLVGKLLLQQDAEDDLRDDHAGWFHPLGELVDVREHQIVERTDDQDQSGDERRAGDRDDFTRGEDDDRDADRIEAGERIAADTARERDRMLAEYAAKAFGIQTTIRESKEANLAARIAEE